MHLFTFILHSLYTRCANRRYPKFSSKLSSPLEWLASKTSTFSFPFIEPVLLPKLPTDTFGEPDLNLPTWINTLRWSVWTLSWSIRHQQLWFLLLFFFLHFFFLNINMHKFLCTIPTAQLIKNYISTYPDFSCDRIITAIPFLLEWIPNENTFFSFRI